MKQLAVWMNDRRVGILTRERTGLAFSYAAEIVQQEAGNPLISTVMPVRKERYVGSTPLAFFEGLLPEGEARQMIAHDFGLKNNDVFAFLEVLGRDCAGSLVIVPEQQGPPHMNNQGSLITEQQIAERLRDLKIAPLGIDEKVRVSLAGMQGKLLLSNIQGEWHLPDGGLASTHIVKPAHSFLSDMIDNEAFCMRVAYHLGINVAEVQVENFASLPALSIERYDRKRENQQITRIHQEDLCQAHGLESAQKYQETGGVSFKSCAQLLKDFSFDPVPLLTKLLDIMMLNVLVGNGDAHAKNLSILHPEPDKIELAPAYDVISTLYYENISKVLGMFINEKTQIDQVTKLDIVNEATSWGLDKALVTSRVDGFLTKAPKAISLAVEEIKPPDKLQDLLHTRVKQLSSQQ